MPSRVGGGCEPAIGAAGVSESRSTFIECESRSTFGLRPKGPVPVECKSRSTELSVKAEVIRYAWPKIKVVFSTQRENNTGPPSLQDPKGRPVSRVKADHTFGLRSKEPVPSSSNQPGSSSAISYVTSTRIRPGASRLSLRRPKLLLQKMASGSFNIIGLREKAGPSD